MQATANEANRAYIERLAESYSMWHTLAPDTFELIAGMSARHELSDSAPADSPQGRILAAAGLLPKDWARGRPSAVPRAVWDLCHTLPDGVTLGHSEHDCRRCGYSPPVRSDTGLPVTGDVCPLCGGRVGHCAYPRASLIPRGGAPCAD